MRSTASHDAVRRRVRKTYGRIASAGGSCCSSSACCSPGGAPAAGGSERLGYSAREMKSVPTGADLGLGCGNPQAIAALKAGEVVLDLGSGAGFDCFLAAPRVGRRGRVIGVDMTPEMVAKARSNARKAGYRNVEFRLGEIENLPVADGSVDVIMSNCVINLSPDKQRVFNEAYRVLGRGGRLAISDVVALRPLPAAMRANPEAYCGCIGGAALVKDVKRMLARAGFVRVAVDVNEASRDVIRQWLPRSGAETYVCSAIITARKN